MARTSRPGAALDDASQAIVDQLRHDGRKSYTAVGRAVGLSEAAVRQRVQRLTDTGILRIVALTNPNELGMMRQAMVGVSTSDDTEVLTETLGAIEEVDTVSVTTGRFDILVEVTCESDEHLLRVVSELRGLPGVTATETFVYLHRPKTAF